jgi:bifunctional enzyme CysN/CysC
MKESIRLVTCGGAEDGKSTLVGRLLLGSAAILHEQVPFLESENPFCGNPFAEQDLAMLGHDLQAERERGFTSEAPWRCFSTERRRFIVADYAGHDHYIREMATAASSAHLAIILIDARKGVLTQTRHHSRIVAMMGIRQAVLAVSKMDLVGFSESTFNAIVEEFGNFALGIGLASIQAIPLTGRDGDNVLQQSGRTPWYAGPSLMSYLDTVCVSDGIIRNAFRMPVQRVGRACLEFSGRIAQGQIRPGDAIRVLPSCLNARIKSLMAGSLEVEVARTGDSITLTLSEEVDVSRGDVLAAADAPPDVADQFEAKLLWMTEHAMAPGRQYLMKHGCKEVTATITDIKHREDVNTGVHLAAKTLGLNEIGTVNLSTSEQLVFEPHARNRMMGGFTLKDKLTSETVGFGMIEFALRRASNIHWQALEISKASRASQKHQIPMCIWFTGLSGSGKSTLANLLEKRLHGEGKHTYLLDGDNVRHGLNRDLGFTEVDRVENIRRVAEVARLMVDAGLIVLVSFISPFIGERRMARDLFAQGEFFEVFVDTPLEECERRDVKGLYAKARLGQLNNFTGIDSPYEAPKKPEIRVQTVRQSIEECVDQILGGLR